MEVEVDIYRTWGRLCSLEAVTTVEDDASWRGAYGVQMGVRSAWEPAGLSRIFSTCHRLSCGSSTLLPDGGYGCVRLQIFQCKGVQIFQCKDGWPRLGRLAWLWLTLVVRSTAWSCQYLGFLMNGGLEPEVARNHCMSGLWSKAQVFWLHDALPSWSSAEMCLACVSLNAREDWATLAIVLGRPPVLDFSQFNPNLWTKSLNSINTETSGTH